MKSPCRPVDRNPTTGLGSGAMRVGLILAVAALCFPVAALADDNPPPTPIHDPPLPHAPRVAVPAHHPKRPGGFVIAPKKQDECNDTIVIGVPACVVRAPRRALPSHHPSRPARAIAINAKRGLACTPWGCPSPPPVEQLVLAGPRTAVPKHPDRRPRGAIPASSRVRPPAVPRSLRVQGHDRDQNRL